LEVRRTGLLDQAGGKRRTASRRRNGNRHHQASRDQQGTLCGIRDRIAKLTPRERQVFDLIIRGKTNKQIGLALDCTERTVKAHRHRVMEKMEVRTLAELVSLAERVGVASATGQIEKH
jgi:FixJ family two-component response regulator